MKKLLIIIFVLVSIAVQAAQIPREYHGRWIYRLYCIGDHPWVYRVGATRLLTAYSNRIEGNAEVLWIKTIKVIEDNEMRRMTEITFKNRPGFKMVIRKTGYSKALSVFCYQDGIVKMLYYFNIFPEDKREWGI